ncbi:uncharacterized protein LAESUDRAFT_716282 [Laetiporus sulphureus 93-53]|uniref:Uncharacterized protein n=1 Tax=Laetiporus sulphureus 93-53 TaxID=1314785 RepID=A0A165CQZ4_9APHY|nr:uncharacterized protein LAESUDRAFT_716282 [Laetiporus sulphureus 93-53]KZT03266.1 hypothetical protein LAESUDRAFT_716282 [Laetiporus sulphureus 93-53]
MFQTITSFLPSALHPFGSGPSTEKLSPTPESPEEPSPEPPPREVPAVVDEQGVKKKRERTNEIRRIDAFDECRHRWTHYVRCGASPSNDFERGGQDVSQRATLLRAPSRLIGSDAAAVPLSHARHTKLEEAQVYSVPRHAHAFDAPSSSDEVEFVIWRSLRRMSFIVVRPPPSKTNHPLNLQVQLVPPSSKERPSTSHSTESGADGEPQASQSTLTRTRSNQSDRSMYSNYSTSSLSTINSSSSSSSGRRMIIPLYNLQAHNVMQNVILDAGTDAKIAKFMKRGLEVIGLAVLEPVEVWGVGSGVDETGRRISFDYAYSAGSAYSRGGTLSPLGLHTPTSSAVSLETAEGTSEQGLQTPMPPEATSTVLTASTGPRQNGRKFFGKLFNNRKKENGVMSTPAPLPLSPATSTFSNSSTVPELSKRSKRASLLSTHALPIVPLVFEPLQPPVLGIQPSLRSPTMPPRGRPSKYVWVVRRWLKGEPESMLSGVKERLQEARGTSSTSLPGLESTVEVRFEWSRGKSSTKRRGRDGGGERSRETSVKREGSKRRNRNSIGTMPDAPSLQHQQFPSSTQKSRTLSSTLGVRRSMESARSTSPGPAGSIITSESTEESARARPRRRDREGEDDGEESDPEDSETPWTCTLVVRRLSSPSSPPRLSQPASLPPHEHGPSIRLRVAVVVPTPHHPKVVALLKVPFPLPDIEVERIAVRKRIITPQGIARPAPPSPPASPAPNGGPKTVKFWSGGTKENGRVGGLMLTAEEIKDVVSCTALWLVVREAFGGVGRERRKGDGWRLRG